MTLIAGIIGSFVIFTLVALALGIGILTQGRPMHAGCRAMPDEGDCETGARCAGGCKRGR